MRIVLPCLIVVALMASALPAFWILVHLLIPFLNLYTWDIHGALGFFGKAIRAPAACAPASSLWNRVRGGAGNYLRDPVCARPPAARHPHVRALVGGRSDLRCSSGADVLGGTTGELLCGLLRDPHAPLDRRWYSRSEVVEHRSVADGGSRLSPRPLTASVRRKESSYEQ